jgi:hypothetical protein
MDLMRAIGASTAYVDLRIGDSAAAYFGDTTCHFLPWQLPTNDLQWGKFRAHLERLIVEARDFNYSVPSSAASPMSGKRAVGMLGQRPEIQGLTLSITRVIYM